MIANARKIFLIPNAHYLRVSPVQDRDNTVQKVHNNVRCLFCVLQCLTDFLKCPMIVLNYDIADPDKEAANI